MAKKSGYILIYYLCYFNHKVRLNFQKVIFICEIENYNSKGDFTGVKCKSFFQLSSHITNKVKMSLKIVWFVYLFYSSQIFMR